MYWSPKLNIIVSGACVVLLVFSFRNYVVGHQSYPSKEVSLDAQLFTGNPVVYFVDSAVIGGSNDGSSWSNAFKDLQDALLLVIACDTIKVAKGTYYPDGAGGPANDPSRTFNIPDSLIVLGGYPTQGVGERDWRSFRSILSGEVQQDNDSTNNSWHIVSTSFTHRATQIDGFYLTGGNANSFIAVPGFEQAYGGAWYNDHASPTIRNCFFYNNTAALGGGAMYNNGKSGPESSPLMINCEFRANDAREDEGGNNGGAMFNDGLGTNGNSSPTCINSIFSGNKAGYGGAIYNNGALNGGISNPVFINCVFNGNCAGSLGGVMYNDGNAGFANPSLTNCILWNNKAFDDPLLMEFGGHVFYNNGTSNPFINYSIIQTDSAGLNTNCMNCFKDGGNNKFKTNPLFVLAPPDSAAPTLAGDFHVLAASPAIDMGLNDSVSVSTDLDNETRIFNDTVDIGAYEMGYDCNLYSIQGKIYVDSSATGIR